MGARAREIAIRALPFGMVLAAWAMVASSKLVDPAFLPSPRQVLARMVELASLDFLVTHLLPSAARVTGAFLLSVAIALPLGVLTGRFRLVERLVQPLFGFARYLPVAALVPLCILWFGVDDAQKVAVIVMGVVFQLVLLLAYDSASVPIDLVEAGRTFGLNRRAILTRIVMPAAMPAMWDHLRIAAGWAWSYLVLSELVAGRRGVGYFVVQSQRYLQTDQVFAGILFIGLLGLLTDWLFRVSATRLFRWT